MTEQTYRSERTGVNLQEHGLAVKWPEPVKSDKAENWWMVQTPMGTYCITHYLDGGWSWWLYVKYDLISRHNDGFATRDEAFADAKRDFQETVAACIEPQAEPDLDPVPCKETT